VFFSSVKRTLSVYGPVRRNDNQLFSQRRRTPHVKQLNRRRLAAETAAAGRGPTRLSSLYIVGLLIILLTTVLDAHDVDGQSRKSMRPKGTVCGLSSMNIRVKSSVINENGNENNR